MASQTVKLPVLGEYSQPTGLFINNEFVKSVDIKEPIDVINPYTEELICSVQNASPADVDIAVKAARNAFNQTWSKMIPQQRGTLLYKLADLIRDKAEVIAAIESIDNGKPIKFARLEVQNVANLISYYAGWADKIEGKVVDTDSDSFNYVKKEPLGVCGQIIPWNFPLPMFAWKFAPAVTAGNTIVIKTSEITPLSALYVAQLIKEAGFPPGVVNIVTGYGPVTGAALSSHMDVDKIGFTGSTLVGRLVMKAAADSNLKKISLELGGKSPNLVFDDADIDQAISWTNYGIFYNQGQTCCAGSRLYVQEGIYDKFVEKFRERTQKNFVGDPFDPNTFLGPQVSKAQLSRVLGFIEKGKQEGATLVCGGSVKEGKGFFIEPTLFTDVKPDMTIMKDEIFGPVLSIAKFKTIEEAIALANQSVYGLAAAVHTTNLNTALQVSSALRAGTVWVNTYNMLHHQLPFGGYKQSGIGRDLGAACLDEYVETKSVRIWTGEALFK